MNNLVSIIISQPPISMIDTKEAIDLGLVFAAFEQSVNFIFINQGVLHLLNNQDTKAIDDKLHDRQLKALPFYEIETIYAEAESLAEYRLTSDHLIETVECLDTQSIHKLVNQSKQTFVF